MLLYIKMSILIDNRKAKFDYEVLDEYEAGIELIGSEVKSLKNKRGNFAGAYISIRGGEAFLVGADIPPYQPSNAPEDYDPLRVRKLLLSKRNPTSEKRSENAKTTEICTAP
jgi:SsrA-binding protein